MFHVITKLFSTKSTKPVSRKVSLSFDAMETRYAPAVLNLGAIRGFDPQPEPPGGTTQAGVTNGIIISGGYTARGIIISGG
jgi:hypothetical protein